MTTDPSQIQASQPWKSRSDIQGADTRQDLQHFDGAFQVDGESLLMVPVLLPPAAFSLDLAAGSRVKKTGRSINGIEDP